MATALELNSLSDVILNDLGITGWQLQDAVYNGCSFVTFGKSPFLESSATYQDGVKLINTIKQGFGVNNTGLDPNATNRLVQTLLGFMRGTDKLHSGIVIKPIPYSNRVETEDMGFMGNEFVMNAIFVGQDYLKARENFINAIKNPPLGVNYKQLIHPILGKIKGITEVVGTVDCDNDTGVWRGSVMKVTFRTQLSNVTTLQGDTSDTQKIINGIQAGLGVVAGLGTAVATSSVILKQLNPLAQFTSLYKQIKLINPVSPLYNPINYSDWSKLQSSLNLLSNVLLNSINYIYKKAGQGVSIPTLDILPIDYTYLSPSLNDIFPFSVSQISIILGYYIDLSIESYVLIEELKLGVNGTSLITQIEAGISSLLLIAENAVTPAQYNTYIVPFNMSMRRVLANNNLPISLLSKAVKINPNLFTSNVIPKNTIVNLPS